MRLVPRLPLQLWLMMSHGGVLVAPVLVLYTSGAFGNDLRSQTHWDLEHQGALIAMLVESEVQGARHGAPSAEIADVSSRLNPALREAKASTRSGIEIVDTDGIVVATSGTVLGEDLSDHPEVEAALDGRSGMIVRPKPGRKTAAPPPWSESRRANVRVFVTVPVVVDEEVIGAIVLSRTPRDEIEALYQMAPGVASAAVVAVIGTLLLAGVAAWVATRSLEMLDRGAERIADGDFGGLRELERPRRSHLTEVAHTANAIASMAERLRERLAYIAEFASNVSHEFKTPIATLRGTVELLSDDEGMPAEQRTKFLANATGELERLERMVSGLLSLARADEAGVRVDEDLQGLLAEVAAIYDVPLTGIADAVSGDRAQLESVVTNLVDNARQHGGPTVVVAIEAFTEPGWTGFTIVDDGRGISPANLPQVFDRFFTTDRGGGGTGLGLALVRTIVLRHGGDVTVDSQPGRTAFTVRLPRP